jgi:hypothetical protein
MDNVLGKSSSRPSESVKEIDHLIGDKLEKVDSAALT